MAPRRLLYMKDLCARMRGERRLDNVSFFLEEGETHALLSTSAFYQRGFCELLCGDILSYTGGFEILGKPFQPGAGLERDIQVIGLESLLFPNLSVAENIMIGSLRKYGAVRSQAMERSLNLMRRVGISIDITKPVSALTQDEQKTLEVLRVCAIQPSIVLFFDVTNYFSGENQGLIPHVVHWLKRSGHGIIYLTSSFDEALEVADRISVLDSGTVRGPFQVENVRENPDEIAGLLSGWRPLVNASAGGDEDSVRAAISSIDDLKRAEGELKRMLSSTAGDLCKAVGADGTIIYLIDEARLNVIDVIFGEDIIPAEPLPALNPIEVLRLLQLSDEQVFRRGEEAPEGMFPPGRALRTVVCYPVRLDGKKSMLLQLFFGRGLDVDQQMSVYLRVFARELAMNIETSRLLGNSVLLQETHHRIKNNLQMIHNLLYLQRAELESGRGIDPAEVLNTAMHRIKCIASVHALLSRDWFGRNIVNLQDLVLEIVNMYRGMSMEVETKLDSVSIPYNDAISVALVTNELISNCVKHAFPDGALGSKIVIELRGAVSEVTLSVRDNGVGMDRRIDPASAQSVGMSIIRGVVAELRGAVRYLPAEPRGTEALVRFQRQRYPPMADV